MKRTSTQTPKMESEKLEAQIYDMAVRSGMFVPIDARSTKYKTYMIIRGPDDQWNVFLMPRKILLATTYLKVSAFAIAKLHDKNMTTRIDEVAKEDKVFQKNYTDSLFYKNTMKVAKDYITKDTALWRWEIVNEYVKASKTRIDDIFYSSLR
jgi:hypothetical protein